MLGIQTARHEGREEGICAIIYGEKGAYTVEVYRINNEVAAANTKDIRADCTNKFYGEDALLKGRKCIEDVCGESPVSVNEGNRLVVGNGFSAACASKILGKYVEDYC
ncbi:hypothetical protein HYU07_05350 [Candidatus Woesearchaeota archaeon]|nr:hypothetical protein [Candidatus Woesearchaeota archaeon]